MIRLLMFDFDGTLFDTAPGIHTTINRMMAARGLEPVTLEKTLSYIGGGLAELARRLSPELHEGHGHLQEIIEEFRRLYRDVFLTESEPYAGVVEFLNRWPHHKAIVSNKSEFFVRELVQKSDLGHMPWLKILGGDTLPVKKPHPQGLLECLKAAQVESHEALMIGDGTPDVGAALAAGVRCVAVDYGYTPVEQLISQGAHARISRIEDLYEVIRQFG